MLRRILACAAAVAVVTASLAACSTRPADAPATITVSTQNCGSGWTSPRAGQQTFELRNRDIVGGEVFLVDAASGAVVAYVDNVGPGATADLSIDLGSGRYAFRCAMSDSDVAHGKTVVVPGSVAGGAVPVTAVTTNDLVPAIKAYQSYVLASLPKLRSQVATLWHDIRSGDLARARKDWLTAHLSYERLGAAYGAFGAADKEINGTTAGLAGGVDDPKFTGFHRIEYGLWHGQSAHELAPVVAALSRDVATLAAALSTNGIQPLDLAVRAHEIAENALQFELTGQTNYGSDSNLATVEANLQGTSTVLGMLHTVIAPRYPELAQTTALLAKASTDVAATDTRSLADLATSQRELIDSDLSELTELLAPIASICEPRRTS